MPILLLWSFIMVPFPHCQRVLRIDQDKLNHGIALASEAVSKCARKPADWIELAGAINKLFSTEEKFMQRKGDEVAGNADLKFLLLPNFTMNVSS